MDYLFGFAEIVPWRCEECEGRFYARPIPFRFLFYAHCGICGNLKLKRISAEHVPGILGFFGRVLRFPAWRCEPCRHKFFSLRPQVRESGEIAANPSH
jgi:ribosomal protein L37AE/L43A